MSVSPSPEKPAGRGAGSGVRRSQAPARSNAELTALALGLHDGSWFGCSGHWRSWSRARAWRWPRPKRRSPLRLDGGGDARLLWTRSFASPGDDWINDIVPISGGRFLAVGFLDRNDSAEAAANDWRALAVALGDDGAVSWSREYGVGSGIDAFWSAREAADDSFAFAGFTTRIGAGGIDGYALFTGAERRGEAGARLRRRRL